MHREGPRQYEAWGASQCRQGVIFVEKQSLQLTVCPARSPRCSAVTNPAPFPPVLRPDSPLRPLVRGTLQSVVERSLRGCEPAPASGPDPRAANHRASGRRATREKGGPRFAVAIASRSGRQGSAASLPRQVGPQETSFSQSLRESALSSSRTLVLKWQQVH